MHHLRPKTCQKLSADWVKFINLMPTKESERHTSVKQFKRFTPVKVKGPKQN